MANALRDEGLLAALLLAHRQGLDRGTVLARQVDGLLRTLQRQVRQQILVYDPGPGGPRLHVGLLGWLIETLSTLLHRTYQEIETVMAAASLTLALQHAEDLARQLQEDEETIVFDPVVALGILAVALRLTPFPSATVGRQPSALASEWWQRQALVLTQRLQDQLRAGALAGESPSELARRITGTPALRGQDGLMAAARRSAEVVAQAQAAMAITQGTEAVVGANEGQIAYLVHITTRDDRTSAICLQRDGKRFDPVTHEPIGHTLPYLSGPPYHMHCRSYIGLRLEALR
jgi:hypothetical protein